MLFKNIAANKEIKEHLIRSVREDRVSHAQLFLGPEGCGHLPLAIAYARYVNCNDRQESDACGKCNSCLKFEKLIHPDLHFVYPVNKTKAVTKDPVSDDFITDWRQLLLSNPYFGLQQWYDTIGMENKQGNIGKDESASIIRKLSLKTYEGDYKIMLIWMAEKMNESCANKILKILEEPPDNTLFLLVCESTDTILPTILSRTQIIKIPKLTEEEIREHLEQRNLANNSDIKKLAHLANGNFFRALQLARDENIENPNHDMFVKLMRLAYKKDVPGLMEWVDETGKSGREDLKMFFEYALHMVRNNFLMNYKLDKIIYLDNEQEEFSGKFHTFINHDNINALVKEFSLAHTHIEYNGYGKLVLLDMGLKMFGLINPRKNV